MKNIINTLANVIVALFVGAIVIVVISWIPMLMGWGLGYGLHKPDLVWVAFVTMFVLIGIIALAIENENQQNKRY